MDLQVKLVTLIDVVKKKICKRKWGHWGSWGRCENGWQTRKKSFVGGHCQGAEKETRSCTGKTTCNWGHWGSWGRCENGWQRREKSFVGDNCQGTRGEGRSCTTSKDPTWKPCHICADGGSSWSSGETKWNHGSGGSSGSWTIGGSSSSSVSWTEG